jgi:hypothetical protein
MKQIPEVDGLLVLGRSHSAELQFNTIHQIDHGSCILKGLLSESNQRAMVVIINEQGVVGDIWSMVQRLYYCRVVLQRNWI